VSEVNRLSSKPQMPPRRKRLLINPRFQAVFALYAILTTFVMVPIFVAANYYFFNLFAMKANSLGLPADHQLLQFVERQQKLMVVVFILATGLATMINVTLSYIFSNRIAGSMYRLTTTMNRSMNALNADKIHARKFDFFKEVYEA
jgi:hypothetical protein